MADRPKTTPKKPPAHEVILSRLKELEKGMRLLQSEHDITARSGGDSTAIALLRTRIALLQAVFNELIRVLATMHLPEHEGPKILDAVQSIDGAYIFPGADEQRTPWNRLRRMLEEQLGIDPSNPTPRAP